MLNSARYCSLTRAQTLKISSGWYFFQIGAAIGNWSAIIPSILVLHDIDNALFGGILIASIFGAIIAAPTVAFFIKKFGSQISAVIGAILINSLSVVIGIPGSTWILAVGVSLLGFGVGWSDVSLNSQALLCEKLTGKSTLGFLHSAYAVGALFGVLYGGALVQAGESVINILILLVFILTPFAFVFMFGLMSFKEEMEMRKIEDAVTITDRDQEITEAHKVDSENVLLHRGEDTSIEQGDVEAVDTIPLSLVNDEGLEENGEGSRNAFLYDNLDTAAPNNAAADTVSLIDPTTLVTEEKKAVKADYWNVVLLCSLGGLAYTGEGSVGDWSTVYLVINLKSSPVVGVLGFAVFQIITAIFRYCSDSIVEHVDRKILMQIAGCLAGLGLIISAIAPSLPEPAIVPIAIVGFGICGAGLSVVAPIVIHYAGRGIKGFDPTQAVAIVSSVSYAGVLVGPPLFGGLSVALGELRWSILLDGIIMSFIFVLARWLPSRVEEVVDENSDMEEFQATV